MCTLGDGESHDAVDADRGEEESEHGEGAEYEDGEAVGDKVFADDLVHGADVGHGEIGIHGTDGGGDAGGDGGRIAVGADGDGRVGPRGLVKGKVNFGGAGGCGMAFVLDVVEDADDLPFDGRAERGNLVGEQLDDFDALGERVESGKVLAGEAFADHGDAGCSGEVARVEIAAAGEADAVGCVVARRDSINDGLRLLVDVVVGVIEGLPSDREVEAAGAFGRQAGSNAYFQDAGDGGDSFFELLVDGADLGGARGAIVLDGDTEGEDVVASNAEVDLGDVPEAS